MAIITTTIVPILGLFPWSDATGQQRTVQPIAELVAAINQGSVAATGAGDTQFLIADFGLPPNFSYVLTDASAMIRVPSLPALHNWDVLAGCVLLDPESAAPRKRYSLGFESPGAHQFSTTASDLDYVLHNKPPTFQTRDGFFFIRFVNVTENDLSAELNMTFRFLVFTKSQEYDSGVNSPLLTR